MTDFLVNQRRDASDVIRGYVYQVELSVFRWLNLKPSEQLELEGGEDIDLISQCKLDGAEQRLLEQIKNLSGAVTLRSALSSIANFVEHCCSNPEHNLYFLFTTTASITTERSSPNLLKGQSGISVWEKLRQEESLNISQADALEGLRQILSTSSRPEKIPEATWNVFSQFIKMANDAEFLDLIQRFQWNTSSAQADSLRSMIEKLLLERQYVSNLSQAQRLYERLFLYVIKRLAAPRVTVSERKILTIEHLTNDVLLTPLDEADRVLIEAVVAQLYTLTTRVEVLEGKFEQFPSTISTQIEEQFQQHFGHPSNAALLCLDPEVTDKVQSLISEHRSSFVQRSEEAQITAFLNKNSSGLLAIKGSAGLGKTALLANWVQSQVNETYFVAYHFFSQRYDATRSITRAYRNLLQQLYEYYGLSFAQIPNDEAGQRRAIYNLLKSYPAAVGRPLVIVLDALDEAETEFEPPFPVPLPENIFVIFSGRADEEEPEYLQKWLESAEQLQLRCLPREAISMWLMRSCEEQMRSLAKHVDFVSQVHEITQGFPLYLNCLIDDLDDAAIKQQDIKAVLARSPQGFEKYIEQQFRQLDRLNLPDQHWQFFTLLSVTKGAIERDAIKAITGMRDRQLRELDRQRQIMRWIKHERGLYSFVHPLLGTRFAALLVERDDETEIAIQALLSYCSQWQQNSSPYALRHYIEHLYEQKQWDTLFGLARDTRFLDRQRKVFQVEPDLPLKTVQVALNSATEIDNAAAIAEFLLQHAHLFAKTTLQESPLIALRSGNFNQALNLTQLHQSQTEFYILWSLLLVWELKDNQQHNQANQILETLSGQNLPRLSRRERSELWQAHVATTLLTYVFEVNPDICIKLGRSVLDQNDYELMCQKLCDRGHDAVIFDALRIQVENDLIHKTQVFGLRQLQEIAEMQAKRVSKDVALQSLSEIAKLLLTPGWELSFTEAWARIAQVEANLGEKASSIKHFANAINIAKRMENEDRKFQDFSIIVYHQKKAGDSDSAFLTIALETWQAAEFSQLSYQIKVLVEIVALQVVLLDQDSAEITLKQAMQLTERVGDSEERAEFWIAITKGLIDAGKLALIPELYQAKSGHFSTIQEPILSYVVIKHVERKEFTLALETALQIQTESIRDEAISKIAIAQINELDFDAASTAIAQIGARHHKDAALLHLVEVQIQQPNQTDQTLDPVLDGVWKIKDRSERLKALLVGASQMCKSELDGIK